MNKNNRIYFIKSANGLVKIGKSNNPSKRLETLQVGSPVKLKLIKTIQGGIYMETLLHNYFRSCRCHGEWFDPNVELNRYLAGTLTIKICALIDSYRCKNSKIKRGMRRYLNTLAEKTGWV